MGKHTQSIDADILARIHGRGAGYVFTASDFLDLGSRSAVDQALSRNCRAGNIHKVARGIYHLSGYDPLLGNLSAGTNAIAQAMARRDAARLQPTGAYAANLLGLSDQVPMRVVYLTDGRSRQASIGNRTIILRHTTPRNMATAGRISGTVIQALRWLGQKQVDDRITTLLNKKLDTSDKKQLLDDIRYAPTWIARIIRSITADISQP